MFGNKKVSRVGVETTSTTNSLRERTTQLHNAAEHSTFQKSLLKGSLQLPEYISFLSQLYLIHKNLEERLRVTAISDPTCGPLILACRFREGSLKNDLESLGRREEDISPLKATRSYLRSMDRAVAAVPRAILGYFYVLEGSTNGGRFIAKAVRRTFHLHETGSTYFDPYGESQLTYWREFKGMMDAIPLELHEFSAIEQAAMDTFRAVVEIGDEILASRRAASVESQICVG
ncbi:MAG: biliverdin-producing heme oxygenase [Planctomycetota bacterium]